MAHPEFCLVLYPMPFFLFYAVGMLATPQLSTWLPELLVFMPGYCFCLSRCKNGFLIRLSSYLLSYHDPHGRWGDLGFLNALPSVPPINTCSSGDLCDLGICYSTSFTKLQPPQLFLQFGTSIWSQLHIVSGLRMPYFPFFPKPHKAPNPSHKAACHHQSEGSLLLSFYGILSYLVFMSLVCQSFLGFPYPHCCVCLSVSSGLVLVVTSIEEPPACGMQRFL